MNNDCKLAGTIFVFQIKKKNPTSERSKPHMNGAIPINGTYVFSAVFTALKHFKSTIHTGIVLKDELKCHQSKCVYYNDQSRVNEITCSNATYRSIGMNSFSISILVLLII